MKVKNDQVRLCNALKKLPLPVRLGISNITQQLLVVKLFVKIPRDAQFFVTVDKCFTARCINRAQGLMQFRKLFIDKNDASDAFLPKSRKQFRRQSIDASHWNP